METIFVTINAIAAIGVGILTFVVSRRALKACPMLDSPVVAFCVAGLTGISLGEMGVGGGLLLLYAVLGLTLLFAFLLFPFLKDKKGKKEQPPPERNPSRDEEDPWEKEMRRQRESSRRRLSR